MKARASGRHSGVVVAALLTAGVVGGLAALWGGGAVQARTETAERHRVVRWDIARYVFAYRSLVVGGHATWRSSSGASITLTGSGQAEARQGEAAGGGLWTRKNAAGKQVGSGAYVVTGFQEWRSAGGDLLANVSDAIGDPREGRSGVLKLRVRLGNHRGRLVLSSDAAAGGPVSKGFLVFHTASGGRIKYHERTRPKGQVLFHVIR
ncbi:MAG: hypothetical protein M3P18_01745 [Actinomycetota bacterium]|nr:hypothetical protein [Actinomycetota bacterium]